MKNDTLSTVAAWVLRISVILSVFGFFQFSNQSRTMRKLNTSLQTEMQHYQQTHQVMNLLMAEAVEYSKRNPDIDPILESVGAKQSKTSPVRK